MNTYTVVLFDTIDNDIFNILNNAILEQKLNFNVVNNNNIHRINLNSNDPLFDVNQYLQDKVSTSLNIITNDDYKSLLNLLYNEQHSIIKYNDINIIKIQAFYNFDSNEKNISSIKNNFLNKIQSNAI
tara:strand:- start:436 stop:819 length:384 start_codon:yes stop_codon:yes gene_type:complete